MVYVNIDKSEMGGIKQDFRIVEEVLELVSWHRTLSRFGSSSLLFVFHLDLVLNILRLILPFVRRLLANALVIQALPENLLGLITPDFLPLALSNC